MKIIIIGAGISGLSAYLFLQKHLSSVADVSIRIYEAYDVSKLTPNVIPLSEASSNEPVFTPVAIGSAIGIGKNGLRVLGRMSEDGRIMRQAVQRGNLITAWRLSNARGWTLADHSMVARAQDDKSTNSLLPEDTGSLMIARQDLWEIVRDEALKSGALVSTKRVTDIQIGDASEQSIVTFDDGTSDTADLIIGADGLRSALRRAMFCVDTGETAKSKRSPRTTYGPSQTPDHITPHYEGLGGVGGFIPTKELQRDGSFDPKIMNIVFGPNGFFGYGCVSSSPVSTITINSLNDFSPDVTDNESNYGTVSAWWSTFSTPNPYPYRREVTVSNNQSSTKPAYTFDSAKALKDLQTRHKDWKNPSIQRILQTAVQTGLTKFQYYPTWTTPVLPTWHKNGNTILIGDAAHTLQPSSGQGASQALEDAEALALILAHYLVKHRKGDKNDGHTQHDAITLALTKFEDLRRPRISMIHARSQKMSMSKHDMGFLMEMIMYFFIWLSSYMHDSYNDAVMNYDLPGEVAKLVAQD